jgi:hypothetical protein
LAEIYSLSTKIAVYPPSAPVGARIDPMPTIKVYINTKAPADLIEFPDKTWDAWNDEQRQQMLYQLAKGFLNDNVTYGAYVVEVPSE